MKLIHFKVFVLSIVLSGCLASASSTDDDDDGDVEDVVAGVNINVFNDGLPCPVGLINGMTLDDEFGPGTAAITRCLNENEVKVVYNLNKTCANADCTRPFGLVNLKNAVDDYVITHGLTIGADVKLVAVVYGAGSQLILNNDAAVPFEEENPFQEQVQNLMDSGVTFFFCQNTARNKGVVTDQLIPGVNYVTAGVTAIADFQEMEYSLINP